MIGVDLTVAKGTHLLHEQLDRHDGEQVRDVRHVGDSEREVIFAGRQCQFLAFPKLLILLLDLLHFPLVLGLNLLLAVSNHHYKGIAGVHLVESVHHHCEGLVA